MFSVCLRESHTNFAMCLRSRGTVPPLQKVEYAYSQKLHVDICSVSGVTAGRRMNSEGAITSKIKHAIKHKTSPARLAQLLQSRTGRYAAIGNSYASLAGLFLSFIACFMLLVIAP